VIGLDARQRVQVTVTADLPSPRDTQAVVDVIAVALRRVRTTEVMVVAYGPREQAPDVVRFADLMPWPVELALLVAGQRWWHLPADDDAEGHPIVIEDRVQVPLAVRIGVPATSRQALVSSLAPARDDVRDLVRRHLATIEANARHGKATQDSDHDRARAAYAALVRARRERESGPSDLPADQAAVLLLALDDLTVRDACAPWHDDAALALWLDLTRIAPDGWAAPAATLLAFAAYQRGNGTLARLAADRALDDIPDYPLAALVATALDLAIPPHGLSQSLAEALRDNPLQASPPTA